MFSILNKKSIQIKGKTMNWYEQLAQREEHFDQVLSFEEYMDIFKKQARRECRTSSIYLKDMFDFYGKDDNGRFNLFQKEHDHAPAVRGQIPCQNKIYNNILNFIEEGYNNRFILLIGPNGSSKSSLVKKIMLACEDYSNTDEGALFTFSWIFPIDNYVKGSVGLSNNKKSVSLNSFAHLEDVEISAIVSSELKDHPILLLPLEVRQKCIDNSLKDYPELLEDIKKTYLYNGGLSKRNNEIYNALLKNYKGNYEEVLKHIRIERFYIDKRYSNSAVTIDPQMHVDAKLQQITMDRRLASLPPSLQSLNLFSLSGEVVLANRGVLEFSDLFKRPIDAFKYLLTTMESRAINLSGILTELDIFFIGTSNEIHFSAFKQHPDFNSFKGRFRFVKVPYLSDYLEEEKIYEEQIDNLKDRCHFEPNSVKALSLWAVLTRMRKPLNQNYKDRRLGEIMEKMNPLEKALFISQGILPDRINSKDKQLVRRERQTIIKEFSNDPLYEGKFGISPREIKQIIYEIASLHRNCSFVDVLEYMRTVCKRKSEYDFLNIAPQADYHNALKFIELIENYMFELLDNEVRECLGLVDDRSYEDYIEKYIMHISAFIKGEKLKNSVTGKYEVSDQYFIKEFETNISLKESTEEFRSHLISRLAAFYLDNPNENIVYTEIFSDLVTRLRESFREEQQKFIDKISKNMVFYLAEQEGKGVGSTNKEESQLIDDVIEKLVNKYNYSKLGAINLLKVLIKKRY
jgi:predicted Ser/Thr protein kinase